MEKDRLFNELNVALEAIKKSIELESEMYGILVKEEDSKKKPVVPQFVADFYEKNKESWEEAIEDFVVEAIDKDVDFYDEMDWWYQQIDEPIHTLVSMKQGYVVPTSVYLVGKKNSLGVYLKSMNLNGGEIWSDRENAKEFISEEKAEAIAIFLGGEVYNVNDLGEE